MEEFQVKFVADLAPVSKMSPTTYDEGPSSDTPAKIDHSWPKDWGEEFLTLFDDSKLNQSDSSLRRRRTDTENKTLELPLSPSFFGFTAVGDTSTLPKAVSAEMKSRARKKSLLQTSLPISTSMRKARRNLARANKLDETYDLSITENEKAEETENSTRPVGEEEPQDEEKELQQLDQEYDGIHGRDKIVAQNILVEEKEVQTDETLAVLQQTNESHESVQQLFDDVCVISFISIPIWFLNLFIPIALILAALAIGIAYLR